MQEKLTLSTKIDKDRHWIREKKNSFTTHPILGTVLISPTLHSVGLIVPINLVLLYPNNILTFAYFQNLVIDQYFTLPGTSFYKRTVLQAYFVLVGFLCLHCLSQVERNALIERQLTKESRPTMRSDHAVQVIFKIHTGSLHIALFSSLLQNSLSSIGINCQWFVSLSFCKRF